MRPAKPKRIDTPDESGRQWRRESSPCTGKPSARPAGKPGDFFLVEGEFATIPSCHFRAIGSKSNTWRLVCVFKAWRNLSGPMWPSQTKIKTKPRGGCRAASRWSAPSPGRRTRREDHALAHRPQMSSGRLILNRVARQHCPSPLHRRSQNIMPLRSPRPKGTFLLCSEGDISVLR